MSQITPLLHQPWCSRLSGALTPIQSYIHHRFRWSVRPAHLPALAPLRIKAEAVAAVENESIHDQVPLHAYEGLVAVAEPAIAPEEPAIPSDYTDSTLRDPDDIDMEDIAAALEINSVFQTHPILSTLRLYTPPPTPPFSLGLSSFWFTLQKAPSY